MSEAATEARPRFADLAARYALAGWQFWRTDAADGPQRYFAARFGRVTEPMVDLIEADQFLAKVSGRVR